MPVPASVEDFLELVRKSRVVDDERLRNFEQELLGSSAGSVVPNTLAQRMVREGLLTSFQAKQILHGKWKRFMISGKYKLLELLGAGGMGAVYLCEHVFLRRLVALKVLPVDKIGDPGAVERFYREARAAASLDHPNIVRAHDIDQDEKIHFLVMEYIDGASLQQIVGKFGRMEYGRAANYMKQAAEGLQHAHESKLVHRDIKPGNLLLERGGTLKILDLGLAKFFGRAGEQITEKFDENCVLGTADYLSPEQAMGGKIDIRADIYSLGATFYYLLSGKAPFEEGTIPQKLVWHQSKQPTPVKQLRKDVPDKLLAILDKMLAKDPDERFQTPREVADALAEFAAPTAPPPEHEMPQLSLAATSSMSMSAPVIPKTPSPSDSRYKQVSKVTADKARSTTLARNPALSAPPPSARHMDGLAGSAGDLDLQNPWNGQTPGPMGPLVSTGSRSVVPMRPKSSPSWVYAALGGGAFMLAGLAVLGFVLTQSPASSGGTAVVARPPGTAAVNLPNPNAVAAVQPGAAVPDQLPKNANEPPKVISVDEAAQYLGFRCKIEFVIASTGKSSRFFLNSKDPYHTPGNFTIVLEGGVVDQLKARGVNDLLGLKGRKVRVTGIITLYRDEANKPQIVLEDASLLEIDPPS